MRRVLRFSFWGLLGLALAGALFSAMRPKPVLVDIETARIGPLQVTIDEDGLTRIRERYIVSTPLAGRLE
ncbi:MAG: hypothetical protein KDB22_27330, partial [Planctomycetales bacterium]|nr:hypothetical protein [Planctomycetales bacterium]